MPFCKRENLAEISRRFGIPYATLYGWVRAGRIVLPRDEALLGQLRKDKKGRYYREEDQK
jgi:predicted site-specific integrase-resolvase